MIGEFTEQFEIWEGTEEDTSGGEKVAYSPVELVWGQAVSADSRVREQFNSLDSDVTYIIKLSGEPKLDYDNYKIKRIDDGKWFIPESPPTHKGRFQIVTYVGVRVEQN